MSASALQHKPFIEWGAALQAVPGQSVCGDMYLVQPFPDGALVAVVDGLGHGDEAIAAAKTAIDILKENAGESVVRLVTLCHQGLAKTRGAVMTLASFSARDLAVTWLSVGNVAGLLLRADTNALPPCEVALLRGGVVGYQLPPLRASAIAVAPDDLLILTTDGIRNNFDQNALLSGTAQQIADRLMSRHFKGNDDALALVVRFLRASHE
jgi:hypothetical protein